MKSLVFLVIFFKLYGNRFEVHTKYFRIIYHDFLRNYAIELYKVADNIAEKEMKIYDIDIKDKINIILEDGKIENAFVMPLTNNIYLYVNTPRNNIIEKNYKSWISFVFTHELSHVLLNLKLASPFTLIPQTFVIPCWLHEGLAVYMESRFSEEGRKYSNDFNSYIKMDISENNFKYFSLAGYGSRDAYTYGFNFINFYCEKFGEKKLIQTINKLNFDYSSYLNIFAENVGMKRNELLKEWKLYNENKSNDIYKKLDFLKSPQGEKDNLIVRNGKLYFYNKEEYTYKIYEHNEVNYKEIISLSSNYNFDVSDKDIYYCKTNINIFKEAPLALPYIELLGYKNTKLLNIKSPNNILVMCDKFFYVSLENGKESLLNNNNQVIISNEENFHFGNLNYLDNKIIFDATKDNELGSKIYELNLKNNKLIEICKGKNSSIYGNFIYFSKNYEDVDNIFKYNRISKKIYRLTNVRFGASNPVYLNNKIYFLNKVSTEKDEINLINEEFYIEEHKKELFIESEIVLETIDSFKELNYKKKFKLLLIPSIFHLYNRSIELDFKFEDDLMSNFISIAPGIIIYPDDSTPISGYISAKYTFNKMALIISYEYKKDFKESVELSTLVKIPFYIKNISLNSSSELFFKLKLHNQYMYFLEELQNEYLTLGSYLLLDKSNSYRNKKHRLKEDIYLESFINFKYLDLILGVPIKGERSIRSQFQIINTDTFNYNSPISNKYNLLVFPATSIIAIPKLNIKFDIFKGTSGGEIAIHNIGIGVKLYTALNYEDTGSLHKIILNNEFKIKFSFSYIVQLRACLGLNLKLYKSDTCKNIKKYSNTELYYFYIDTKEI